MTDEPRILTETDGHVFRITLNRADKLNAFDAQMLKELGEAYTTYENDDSLWCAVVDAKGKAFTAGLELSEVGPKVGAGEALFPADGIDPLGLHGKRRTKPLIMAVQGWCLTIGIELLLASDIRIAGSDTRFGQIEINRGIFPFGGATIRLPQIAGWGNAMRWLLTGDKFDAEEALRIGLVQEVVETGTQSQRALELAKTVAKQAPLGVKATLRSAVTSELEGQHAAVAELMPMARDIMETEDAAEGMRSFVERREGQYKGR